MLPFRRSNPLTVAEPLNPPNSTTNEACAFFVPEPFFVSDAFFAPAPRLFPPLIMLSPKAQTLSPRGASNLYCPSHWHAAARWKLLEVYSARCVVIGAASLSVQQLQRLRL